MEKKYVILISFLLSFVASGYAQSNGRSKQDTVPSQDTTTISTIEMMSSSLVGSDVFPDIISPSPEIEMINKFSDYPVNTQTGLPEVNIPLYEIVSGDLKLPITISYHASGRKTYDRNGPLGLHWVLNTGGLISRTVYGIRDDDVWEFPSPFPNVENLTVQNDYDFLAGVNQSQGIVTYYDTEYDIFSYSYNGGSGNFILKDVNNNKVPEIIPNKKIQVNVHKTAPPNYYFDYIEILDEYGVYYRFGKSLVSGDSNRETTGNATTAWFISEIISANKKDTIHFKYTITGKVRETYPQKITLRDNHHFINSHKVASIAGNNNPGTEETFSTTYGSARISEIDFKKGKIVFTLNGSTDIIDKMDVYYEDELIKTIEFPKTLLDAPSGLSTFDASQALIYKLDNVFFKDKNGTLINKYGFDYYPSSNFNVRQSDWWGYYNRSSYTYRIPVFNNIPWVGTGGMSETTSIGNGAANRTPDLTGMQSGMLKSITYPTGGKTEFIYEHNYYKEALTQNIKKCGGLRIAQKKVSDNAGKTIIKTYKYGTNECGYGILNNEPGIGMIGYENTMVDLINWQGWCRVYEAQELEFYRERYYFSDILPQYSIYFDRPVIYPEVTEYDGEITNNNGKAIFRYEALKQYFAELPYYASTDYSISRKYVKKFDYWRDNQLKEKEIFDKNGNKIRKEIYTYASKPKEEVTGMHLEQSYVYPYFDKEECASTFPHPIFSFDDYTVSSGVKLLSSKTDIMYYGANDSVETKTNYTYNNNHLLSKTETIDVSGNLITNYYYPDDYNAVQNFSVLRDPAKNIVAKPIDVRIYIGSQLISGTQTKYNNDGQPIDIYAAEIGSGLTDITFSAGEPYLFTHIGAYFYNTQKRVKQISPDDNISTAYLWDATGAYVMAKVENATYSQISTQDGKVCTYNSLTLFNSLKALVPGAMITTFTHKPLVGITQQTDHAGRTTYYEYDDFGRLKLVRNQNDNIVTKNEYHYENQ